MDYNIAIKVEGLNKTYPIYKDKNDRMKEALSLTRKKYHTDFHALKDVKFQIKRSETIGIVGQNGSGKSTLLKILTGVLSPTTGKVEVNGKVSALLELGAGFNHEMTGIENIYLNGTIMGYTKDQMSAKVPKIIEFADIGAFIEQPVKMYSSGMFIRLAFAVAINVEPEILIVDEALAVGDIRFQQKCYREIDKFKEKGTILMVSHDLEAIIKFCDRAMFLDKGKVEYMGTAKEAVKRYKNFVIETLEHAAKPIFERKELEVKDNVEILNVKLISDNTEKVGDGKALITHAGLFDQNEKWTEKLEPNKIYKYAVNVVFKEKIENLIFGITIKNRLGMDLFGINTHMLKQNIDTTQKACQYILTFRCPVLSKCQCQISPAISSGIQEEHLVHSWIYDASCVNIDTQNQYEFGVTYVDEFMVEMK